MASVVFSSISSAPLSGIGRTKPNPSTYQSWFPSPSMALLTLSNKTSYGSSKSSFFQPGFSFQASNISGFLLKYGSSGVVYARAATEKTIYDFSVKDIDRKDVALSKFKGKVLLIVNVASKCGLTTSNYSELSHIYEKYKTQGKNGGKIFPGFNKDITLLCDLAAGFEILAFPCNQFGGQEPASNPEIKQFACTRFKAEFPIFDKVDVNGPSTAPVYQFLKSSAGGFLGDLIKWNFEKFLVDKNGKVVERYPPTTSPFQIEKDIQKLLAA
ncbi:putative glutathione peroxidase 7, chloroplastic isoform X1 [Cornus florida]|uniref:putative glutathione peroxidase 7, chloroplastic isoform X1 n=1 Tax=Cornus florida TaxID=4283 RepID=UPI002897D44E|nr:putative glutathione peroxidase 7, chloroplastic isoform X1 [Cornus florida]